MRSSQLSVLTGMWLVIPGFSCCTLYQTVLEEATYALQTGGSQRGRKIIKAQTEQTT